MNNSRKYGSNGDSKTVHREDIEKQSITRAPARNSHIKLKAGLGTLGFFSVVMYVAPGKECAADPVCGGKVAEWFPDQAPFILGPMSGTDVGLMNLMMSIKVVDLLTEVFGEEKSVELLAKGIGIALLTTAGLTEKIVLAIGTNAGPLLGTVIVLAALGGAVYGAGNIVLKVIPSAWHSMTDPYRIPDYDHYATQLVLVQRTMEEQEKQLLRCADEGNLLEISAEDIDNPILCLNKYKPLRIESQEEALDEQYFRIGINTLINIVGAWIGGETLTPLIVNAWNKLGAGQLFTPFVCMPVIYALMKLSIDITRWAAQLAESFITGEPIPSALYQLRRPQTLILMLLNILISLESYAVIDRLIAHNFDEGSLKDFLTSEDDRNIVLIHFGSLVHLMVDLYLVFAKTPLGRDERLEVLIRVQKKVEESSSITVDQFIKMLKTELKCYNVPAPSREQQPLLAAPNPTQSTLSVGSHEAKSDKWKNPRRGCMARLFDRFWPSSAAPAAVALPNRGPQ